MALSGTPCNPFCCSTPAAPLLPRAAGPMAVLTSVSPVSKLPQQCWERLDPCKSPAGKSGLFCQLQKQL